MKSQPIPTTSNIAKNTSLTHTGHKVLSKETLMFFSNPTAFDIFVNSNYHVVISSDSKYMYVFAIFVPFPKGIQ